MTLLEVYNAMFKDRECWCYYKDAYMTNPFIDNNFENFIETFFECGAKNNVFAFLSDLNITVPKIRYTHMVSAYFLGIYISDMFFNWDKGNISKRDFLWMWFILCLYHDVGYCFEENTVNLPFLSKYDRLIHDVNINIQHLYFKKLQNPIFPPELISNYFDYCLAERNKVDHGISGALLLYDRLAKNYLFAKEKNGNCDNFTFKGLNWNKKHLSVFAKLASIIGAHNIWVPDNETIPLYEKNNLHDLIGYRHRKPFGKYEKLFYLLCICDAVEPIKKFIDLNYVDVLRNVIIQKEDHRFSISVVDDSIQTDIWFCSIMSLSNYLKFKNIKRCENKIIIEV